MHILKGVGLIAIVAQNAKQWLSLEQARFPNQQNQGVDISRLKLSNRKKFYANISLD